MDAYTSNAFIRDTLNQVLAERLRQNERFGEQNHPDGTGLTEDKLKAKVARQMCDVMTARNLLAWRDILLEEVYEALAESDEDRLYEELIQVAAVAAAWAEAIQRRED